MEAEVYGLSKVRVTTTKAGTLEIIRGSALVATQTVSANQTYTVRIPSIPSVSAIQCTARVKNGSSILESTTFYIGFGDTKEVSLDANAINSDFVVVGEGLVKDGNKIKHTARTATSAGNSTKIPVITTDSTGHVTSLSAVSIPTVSAITSSNSYPTSAAVQNYVDGKLLTTMPSSPNDTNTLSTKAIKTYVGGIIDVGTYLLENLIWNSRNGGRTLLGTANISSTAMGFSGYRILGIVNIYYNLPETSVGVHYIKYDSKRGEYEVKIELNNPETGFFANVGSAVGTFDILRIKN